MSEYLLINIGIAAVPLLLSFDKKVRFYTKLPYILISTIIVGIFYISWDIYATVDNHWSFNPEYTNVIKLFGLPLEEILFFITVPYAMLFLYEVFQYYLKDKIYMGPAGNKIYLIISIIFISAALLVNSIYTIIVLISCALYFFISYMFYDSNLNSAVFRFFILFSFIPFLIVNYLLTSLPVVQYNPDAILGVRILTIPVEDFFYSFSMISFYVMVYTVSIKLKEKLAYDKSRS
jgi:lycopene cyclase domain-containing protein